jgi:hypothetical protein
VVSSALIMPLSPKRVDIISLRLSFVIGSLFFIWSVTLFLISFEHKSLAAFRKTLSIAFVSPPSSSLPMLKHVIRPSRQGTNTRLWTNNNCERMNHRFKISTDWKPQRLLELFNTIHDIVRLHFADLKKALSRQGSSALEYAFQHLYVPHTVWTSKTATSILMSF